MIEIRGVWATPEAREVFEPSELDEAVSRYREFGAQRFIDGIGFALCVYEKGGRELLICDKEGRVSLMTLEEVEAHGSSARPSIFSRVVGLGEEAGPNFG